MIKVGDIVKLKSGCDIAHLLDGHGWNSKMSAHTDHRLYVLKLYYWQNSRSPMFKLFDLESGVVLGWSVNEPMVIKIDEPLKEDEIITLIKRRLSN